MENSNTSKTTSAPKSSNKPNKAIIIIIIIAVICAVAGIVAAIVINNKSNDPNTISDGIVAQSFASEEEQKVTDDTLKRYAKVTIEGYQDVDDPNTSKAVVVKVENISNETTSLAVTIGAYDDDNNLLETSSTYAENIEPGQSIVFNAFVFTELTEGQLSSATFKVYTAKTYTVNGLVEETGEQLEEQTKETPAETETTDSNEDQQ